ALLAILALPPLCKVLGIDVQIGPLRFVKETAPAAAPAGAAARLAPETIATFDDKWPRNHLHTQWGIFTDNKFLGRSSIWYETLQHPDQPDYFLRVHFRLDRGPRPLAPEAYGGIFADWTQPPPVSVDASRYSGIAFRAACSLEGTTPEAPSFLLSLATLGSDDGEYHEADFSRQLPCSGSGLEKIELPFSSFKVPPGLA